MILKTASGRVASEVFFQKTNETWLNQNFKNMKLCLIKEEEMNPNVITIYKKIGETPLACLERLRLEQPAYKDETLSYIGRLDPMAEGAMLVLVGEENKERAKYLSLNKEYEFEVLFGFATDTQDLLGLVTINAEAHIGRGEVKEKIKAFLGKRTQEYPAYSSKPVASKPLHVWAREGRLDEIEIPKKEIEIYEIKLLDFYTIEKGQLEKIIKERIALVQGDFRQRDILARWQEVLAENNSASFLVAKIRVACSSGTYVRAIARELGELLAVPALALSIVRTRIAEVN